MRRKMERDSKEKSQKKMERGERDGEIWKEME